MYSDKPFTPHQIEIILSGLQCLKNKASQDKESVSVDMQGFFSVVITEITEVESIVLEKALLNPEF